MENQMKQSAELRKRAEAVLPEQTPEYIANLSPEEIQIRLHNLRVHQIELELQNDELRRTQAELDVSRARYFDLYNLAPVGYLTLSATGLIVEANLAAASLLGWTQSVFINQPLTHFIHKEDQDRYYLSSKKQFKANAPQEYDLRMVRADSSVFWVRFRAMAAQDAEGAPVCRVVLSDITERKQSEEARRESEERFRLLFENHSAVKLLIDAETGHIVDANTAAVLFYGWPKEQLTQMFIAQLNTLPVASVKAAMGKAETCVQTRFEFCHRIADGTVREVEVFSNKMKISGKHILYSIIHDITDRKKAEQALLESEVRQREQELLQISEARFRDVLEHSLDAAYKRNLRTQTYEYLSPVFAQLSGYTPDELMTLPVETVLGFIHSDDVAAVERAIADSMADVTSQPYHLEYRFQHKDGQYRWFQDRFTVRRDEGGHPVARIGSVSDITERKQAEEVLQDKSFRLASIIDATRIGTWEWNVQTGEVAFNERWAQMLGYTLANLPAEGIAAWKMFAHPDDLQQSAQLLDRHFAGELPCYDIECRMRHRDGHWIWVHDRGRVCTRTKNGEPLMMYGTHLDITERKQIEHQFVESRENYRRVFANQMIGICILDTQTLQIVDVNDTYARLCGYSREELLAGMKITELSVEPEATAEMIHLTSASKSAFSVPLRYHRKKNGQLFPAEVIGEPYMRDGRLVILGFVRDISQRLQVEEELQEIHSQLEHKVLERTADLEKTNATLAMMLDYARKTETDIQERVVANLRANILGIVDVLKKQQLEKSTQELVSLLETTTLQLAHPLARNLESQLLQLTAREMQLANFIRLGKSTKEIVELLNISKKTVESHRDNLRKKLGLANKKINLRTYLNSEFVE